MYEIETAYSVNSIPDEIISFIYPELEERAFYMFTFHEDATNLTTFPTYRATITAIALADCPYSLTSREEFMQAIERLHVATN